MQKVDAILACDINLGIGKSDGLPWPKNSLDMKWFKKHTEGKVCLMGRKTWESLPTSLPDRISIVVSKTLNILPENKIGDVPNCIIDAKDGMGDLIARLQKVYKDRDIAVIGGAQIFRQALPFCGTLILTKFKQAYDCDTFIENSWIKRFQYLDESENHEKLSFSIWRAHHEL